MKTILFALGALAVVSAGCDSEVTGGGGGSGGGGGAGSVTATATSSGETTGTSTSGPTGSTSTSTGTSTSTSTGTGGAGGSGGLGTCEENGGSAVSGGSGGDGMCEADYSCEGGEAHVECSLTGEGNFCECYLDDQLEGSCESEEYCDFPLGCCFALLGGLARPNPGPFGACEGNSGAATVGAGGLSMCDNFYSCEGGELTVSCEETEGGGATCECKEGQGFTLGTCQQETLSCDYESSCCYAIFNP